MTQELVEVEFLKQCRGYKKGKRQAFSSQYAQYLIGKKKAKAIDPPIVDKMIRQASNKNYS